MSLFPVNRSDTEGSLSIDLSQLLLTSGPLELDPLIRTRGSELDASTILKFRGSRVIEGASNGCTLYQEFLTLLGKELNARGYQIDGNSAPSIRPERWICELRSQDLVKLQFIEASWQSSKDELPPISPCPQRNKPFETYLLTAEEGDPASNTIRARPFFHSFTSPESKQWAVSSLQNCDTSHESCGRQSSAFMPTRLLRAHHSDDGHTFLRLEHTFPPAYYTDVEPERYATLTYCWGGDQELQLNATTKGSLEHGIAISSLPQTLLDTIIVIQDLGLDLIWIDCLCIRQDDPLDVAREISQVPAIYRNSFITISASRASHSKEGFLHNYSLPATSEPAFRLPFACPDGDLGSVVLSKGLLDSPINKRAWTLQEYLLSRRVLQFTKAGLHWTCQEASKFQLDDAILPLDCIEKSRDSYRMYRGLYDEYWEGRQWMDIVEEYTTRNLTYKSDKLPAISGAAEVWARASNDSYMAGLWLSHMPLGLLWTTGPSSQVRREAEYRAPSWSWASVDGQIDWFDHLFTAVDPRLAIIACNTTPRYSEAPYGQVTSGSLVIYGCLQRAVLESNFGPLHEDILNLGAATTRFDYTEKVLESKIHGYRLFCLRICLFEPSSRVGPLGLVLATEDERVFRRIGVFDFEPPHEPGVQLRGDYEELFQRYENTLQVQQNAFQGADYHTITIV
ncbi:HET-domain-containing [Fusarium albosuccineum]|uniref:HET-domain-containing n=1 Tax=Fusarium albosuccineum TaxID=1237068 RepID=A0A8H4L0W8_9HYPO|nr:HET-domain-containing [Fusarium albosuccineum]